MVAVEVSANPTFPFGEPKVLSKAEGTTGAWTADHQRVLVVVPTGGLERSVQRCAELVGRITPVNSIA